MGGENWKISHPLKNVYQGNKNPMGDLTPTPSLSTPLVLFFSNRLKLPTKHRYFKEKYL